MKTYAVFDALTGDVIQLVRCHEDEAIGLAGSIGKDLIEYAGHLSPDAIYHDGLTIQEKPPAPHAWMRWENRQWYDPRSLDDVKKAKWKEVKAARAAHIDAGLTTPYGQVQTAPPERQNITDAVLLAQTLNAMGQPVAINWTMADNTVVTLGLTEMVTVGLLLGQRVQEAHAHARTLRAAIDAATTVAEVEAIVWG